MLIAQVAQVIMSNRTNHVARNCHNFKGQRSHVHVSCERKGVVFHGKEQFTFSLPVDIYKQVLGQGEQLLVSLWDGADAVLESTALR